MLVAVTGGAPEHGKTRRKHAFLQLGRWASHYELPLLVTTPEMVFSHRHRFTGWAYGPNGRDSGWFLTTFRHAEPVFYDAMYLADLKDYRTSYRRLLHRLSDSEVPVFNPILPAKDKVYRALRKADGDGFVLPRTWFDVSADDVYRRLREVPGLWLKPTYGSGGRNMMYIQRLANNRYRIAAERFYGERVQREINRGELLQIISLARKYRRYMAQENVPLLHTVDQRKVDLRVTVQRDDEGQWKVTAITGRRGAKDSTLTNYHAGGQITSLTRRGPRCRQWLTDVGMTESDLVRAEESALAAAQRLLVLESNLGLLGIDVGQAGDGSQFVYDCNGRPGRDILTDSEVAVFMKRVTGFAKFLHTKHYS